MNPIIILVIGLVVFLLLRMPIAYSIGLASMLALLFGKGLGIDYLTQTLFNANNSFTLLAVPFFILAGDLMLAGGVSKRLVNCIQMFLGSISGSLAIITVVACMIFAAISGSGPATVAAMGGIMIPIMIEENYDRAFSCSLASAAGSLGPVIPPSVIFVMYGVTAGVSISDLFIAGITPGIIIGIVLIIYAKILVKKNNWGIKKPKATAREKLLATRDAIWAILVPVIILGGIYSGIFTPTEAAVVACVYAIIIGFFVYKELTFKKLYEVFKRSTLTLGSAIIIVAFSSIFGRILTIQQVPQTLASFLAGITDSKIIILIVINIFLFFVGMFMETLSAVLILAPILVPIAIAYGISPIHFGVLMTINLALGLCTPPVGVNTYVASSLGGIKIEEMIKSLLPLIGIMFVTILLISFIEPSSMWLVNLLNG